MKHYNLKHIILFFLLAINFNLVAQDLPSRPEPPRLVNDFTNTLTPSEISTLENKLVNYNDTTSNQIALVITNDLAGYSAADFAYEIGESWGIGNKNSNNGIVILVKPKQGNERGQAAISIGYGLEGAIPDALTKRIIEKEMIPEFKNNNYYQGIDNAIDVIIKLASGEYSADEYDDRAGIIILFVFFLFIIILFLFGGKNNKNIGGNSNRLLNNDFLTGLLIGSLLNGNSSSNSGGSGNYGGFGGFGGGSFGGGGASGSW